MFLITRRRVPAFSSDQIKIMRVAIQTKEYAAGKPQKVVGVGMHGYHREKRSNKKTSVESVPPHKTPFEEGPSRFGLIIPEASSSPVWGYSSGQTNPHLMFSCIWPIVVSSKWGLFFGSFIFHYLLLSSTVGQL